MQGNLQLLRIKLLKSYDVVVVVVKCSLNIESLLDDTDLLDNSWLAAAAGLPKRWPFDGINMSKVTQVGIWKDLWAYYS